MEIGSTNTELAGLARAGAGDGTVVVADHQTSGHGRRGRTWEAPPDSSLLVSVLVRPPAPLVALIAGVAAADACADATGVWPYLKWPNDLLGPGGAGKLGGILSELVPGPDAASEDGAIGAGAIGDGDESEAIGSGNAVVVGLGLNVQWGSPLPPGATDIFSITGSTYDRDSLLRAFLRRLEARLGEPSSIVLAAYRRRCITIGRDVRVMVANDEVSGHATGIDEEGHLLVTADNGQLHVIQAGEVVHATPH